MLAYIVIKHKFKPYENEKENKHFDCINFPINFGIQ
jgi:hypothetical protein